VEDGRPDTVVAPAEFVREADAIQHGIAEGPLSPRRPAAHKMVGSLGGDRAWPRFGPRAAGSGCLASFRPGELAPGWRPFQPLVPQGGELCDGGLAVHALPLVSVPVSHATVTAPAPSTGPSG
jgi:hypothetical protein